MVNEGRVCGIRPNTVLLSWGQGSVAEPRVWAGNVKSIRLAPMVAMVTLLPYF